MQPNDERTTTVPTPIASTVAARRLAGRLAVAGALTMLAGAVVLGAFGAPDLDAALVSGDLERYLTEAASRRTAVLAHVSIWLVGAPLLGAAGVVAAHGDPMGAPHRELARAAYTVGAATALVCFVAWFAVAVQASASPSPTDATVAAVVGWFAYRLDVVATALLIGVGPWLLTAVARPSWAPPWLRVWAVGALAAAIFQVVPYLVPAVPLALGLLVMPVGLGWTLAAGTVLQRAAAASTA